MGVHRERHTRLKNEPPPCAAEPPLKSQQKAVPYMMAEIPQLSPKEIELRESRLSRDCVRSSIGQSRCNVMGGSGELQAAAAAAAAAASSISSDHH